MRRYMFRRILQVIPLLFLITLISYGAMHLAPGGPENILLANEDRKVGGGEDELINQIRAKYGLDKPWYVQYGNWVKNTLQGDFGHSFYQSRSVSEIIKERLPNTMTLNLVVILLTYLIALPLGIISAVRQYSALDNTVTVFAFIGQSMPSFFIALMLMLYVALPSDGLIPIHGMASHDITVESSGVAAVVLDRARYMILPVVTLLIGGLAGLTRYMRSSMLEVIREDYVRTARSKGLAEKVVLYKHAFRNALLPIVTLSSGLLAGFIAGSPLIEQVFAWPGLGQASLRAAIQRDYPVVMAFLVIGAFLHIVGTLLVDVVYVFVDPRIKFS